MAAELEQPFLPPAEVLGFSKACGAVSRSLPITESSLATATDTPAVPSALPQHGVGVWGAQVSACAHTTAHAGEIITARGKLLSLTLSFRGHLSTGKQAKLSYELGIFLSFILSAWRCELNVCSRVMQVDEFPRLW